MAGAQQNFEELTLEKLETFLLKFADDRRTGQLKVQGEGARGGRVDLREGKIVAVDSPFASETLGEVAKKLGFIDKTGVQKAVDALSRSDNAGRQLADILLDEKLLSREALEMCLRYQAESAIHSLIGFHGRISFMPGFVAPAEISLDPREVLKKLKERDHVEEIGSAFLGMTTAPTGGIQALDEPAFDAQVEMRRIAQAVIREAALAAESISRDLEMQIIPPPAPTPAELDKAAEGAAAQLLNDREAPAELPPNALEMIAPAPEKESDRPRLGRIVLEICRPGASSTDALLDYAVFYGRRAILFASTSKGLKVAGAKAAEGYSFPTKLDAMMLPHEKGGAIATMMEERVPARGPFEFSDDADRALAAAVEPVPSGDALMFPIALHERAIGMLYVDGVPSGDPGLLEGLAAAVAATAVVMENKLLYRTNKK